MKQFLNILLLLIFHHQIIFTMREKRKRSDPIYQDKDIIQQDIAPRSKKPKIIKTIESKATNIESWLRSVDQALSLFPQGLPKKIFLEGDKLIKGWDKCENWINKIKKAIAVATNAGSVNKKNLLVAAIELIIEQEHEAKIYHLEIPIIFLSGWKIQPLKANGLFEESFKQIKVASSTQESELAEKLFPNAEFQKVLCCENIFGKKIEEHEAKRESMVSWLEEIFKQIPNNTIFSENVQLIEDIQKNMTSQIRGTAKINYRGLDSELSLFGYLTESEFLYELIKTNCEKDSNFKIALATGYLRSIILNVISERDTCINCNLIYQLLLSSGFLSKKIMQHLRFCVMRECLDLKATLKERQALNDKLSKLMPINAFISSNRSEPGVDTNDPEMINFNAQINKNENEVDYNKFFFGYNENVALHKVINASQK